MVLKKKYHGGLKVLLLLLFTILLGTYSTCYAVDYTDFEIPIEFWDNLITFINSNASNYAYGSTITKTAQEFKNVYDTSLKNDLKNQFINAGADERNLQLFIYNNLNYSINSGKFLQIYFLFSNNTINNIENSSTWLVNSNGKIAQTNMSLSPNIYVLQLKSDVFTVITKSDYYGSHSGFAYNSNIVNYDNSTLLNGPWFGVNQKPLNIVNFKPQGQSGYFNFFLENYYNINPVPIEPEPEEPSGENGLGNIIGPSGEDNGNINLEPIQQELGNITNSINIQSQNIVNTISGEGQVIRDTISGEIEKVVNSLTDVPSLSGETISSGDITNALGFAIASNPYDNFWTTLTNNLKTALTTVKRSIDISFRSNTWTISLDEFCVLPNWVTIILTPFSTAFFTFYLAKQWKHIFDRLSSGNVDSLLKSNSDEGISNLF